MEFRVLGDLAVVEEGQALALGSHQQRAVLALLVLSAGEVVSSDRLIEALWGERPPPTAAKTVQVYISRLRKTLNGAQAGTYSPGELIVTADHGYVLRVDPERVDVRVFERLLDGGRNAFADHEFDVAATMLRQALGLWRGTPLADFTFEAFATAEIARLQELRLEALEIRIDADLELGRHAALVAELEALTTEHPLRERLRAARMLALYRCGREPEALALYRETRRMLVDELGMEPSPALRELHDAILRQDPALKPPAAPRPQPPAGSNPRGRRRRRAALVAATLALAGGVAAVIALLAPGGEKPARVGPNSVAVIDPSSRRLLTAVAVGTRPGPLAQAAGSVWVANLDDNTITGIDATSHKRGGTFTPGPPISGMTAAGKSLWISGASAELTRVDPTVQDVTKLTPIGVYNPAQGSVDAPRPIAVGASSVWVGQPGAVTRLDLTGRRRGLIDGLEYVDAIAVGAGATWVSDTADNVVAKIVDGAVVDRIATGDGPGALAVGHGAVWVAERFAGKVARIDPSSDRVTSEIRVGAAPIALAVIGESVWVANSGDGTLSQIDARTNRVAAPLRIGNSPSALAAVGGRLWVSVQAPAAGVASPVTGPTGGVIRVAYKDDPGSLDPGGGYQGWQILNATCALLYNYPDVSGAAGARIIPEVARAMPAVSRDGLRYTFTIRADFRFSPPSNAPVTAQTFRDVIERALSPRWRPLTMDPSEVPEIAGLGAFRDGRARHISGISASGDRLVIRLTRPAADLPQRLATPSYCAVPGNAPVPAHAPLPMAGPYYVHAYSPGKRIVLARNPNYRGHRPARPNAIDITIGAPTATSIDRVIAGDGDYHAFARTDVSPTETARLRARYGAARGPAHQRFFENPVPLLNFFALNTARPLFANARLRRAVNFAIDRKALAALQGLDGPLRPTDQYLPPDVPGYRDARIYPLGGPDLARARRLAGPDRHHATLITCNVAACPQQARIVRANLAKIGIDVHIEELSITQMFKREGHADGNWDIGFGGWWPGYHDPSNALNPLLRGATRTSEVGANNSHFDDPVYNRRLDAAARLSGTERYDAYARLDADLAGKAAPLIAFGVVLNRDLFSARIGCQIYQPVYGMDLAALCIKRR